MTLPSTLPPLLGRTATTTTTTPSSGQVGQTMIMTKMKEKNTVSKAPSLSSPNSTNSSSQNASSPFQFLSQFQRQSSLSSLYSPKLVATQKLILKRLVGEFDFEETFSSFPNEKAAEEEELEANGYVSEDEDTSKPDALLLTEVNRLQAALREAEKAYDEEGGNDNDDDELDAVGTLPKEDIENEMKLKFLLLNQHIDLEDDLQYENEDSDDEKYRKRKKNKSNDTNLMSGRIGSNSYLDYNDKVPTPILPFSTAFLAAFNRSFAGSPLSPFSSLSSIILPFNFTNYSDFISAFYNNFPSHTSAFNQKSISATIASSYFPQLETNFIHFQLEKLSSIHSKFYTLLLFIFVQSFLASMKVIEHEIIKKKQNEVQGKKILTSIWRLFVYLMHQCERSIEQSEQTIRNMSSVNFMPYPDENTNGSDLSSNSEKSFASHSMEHLFSFLFQEKHDEKQKNFVLISLDRERKIKALTRIQENLQNRLSILTGLNEEILKTKVDIENETISILELIEKENVARKEYTAKLSIHNSELQYKVSETKALKMKRDSEFNQTKQIQEELPLLQENVNLAEHQVKEQKTIIAGKLANLQVFNRNLHKLTKKVDKTLKILKYFSKQLVVLQKDYENNCRIAQESDKHKREAENSLKQSFAKRIMLQTALQGFQQILSEYETKYQAATEIKSKWMKTQQQLEEKANETQRTLESHQAYLEKFKLGSIEYQATLTDLKKTLAQETTELNEVKSILENKTLRNNAMIKLMERLLRDLQKELMKKESIEKKISNLREIFIPSLIEKFIFHSRYIKNLQSDKKELEMKLIQLGATQKIYNEKILEYGKRTEEKSSEQGKVCKELEDICNELHLRLENEEKTNKNAILQNEETRRRIMIDLRDDILALSYQIDAEKTKLGEQQTKYKLSRDESAQWAQQKDKLASLNSGFLERFEEMKAKHHAKITEVSHKITEEKKKIAKVTDEIAKKRQNLNNLALQRQANDEQFQEQLDALTKEIRAFDVEKKQKEESWEEKKEARQQEKSYWIESQKEWKTKINVLETTKQASETRKLSLSHELEDLRNANTLLAEKLAAAEIEKQLTEKIIVEKVQENESKVETLYRNQRIVQPKFQLLQYVQFKNQEMELRIQEILKRKQSKLDQKNAQFLKTSKDINAELSVGIQTNPI